jgi:hypothetical protein
MDTQRIHHFIGIGIRVASSKPDQLHFAAPESIHYFTRNMMCTFHQVGYNHYIPYPFPSIGP